MAGDTGVAGRDEEAGHLRAAQRGARFSGKRRRAFVHGHVQVTQAGQDHREALRAQPALPDQRLFKRLVRRIDPETENVQLAFPEAVDAGGDAVDLDCGHQFQWQ